MISLEHFFIRDNWPSFHAALAQTYEHFLKLDAKTPSLYANQKILEVCKERLEFLDVLLTQQSMHLTDLNDRLARNRNTMTSLLSLFEDEDTIENLAPERMETILRDCNDNFDHMMKVVVNQTHKAQTKAQNAVEAETDADGAERTQDIYARLGEFDVPQLTADASFDSFKDAMKQVLGQMRDQDSTREKAEEIILTPQQRLFLEIQRETEQTISAFGSALRKVGNGEGIQFAKGTVALQGVFNRKGVLGIPHSLVQIGNLRLSAKVSDSMIPTLFLHQQQFVVFRYPPKASPEALATKIDTLVGNIHTRDARVNVLQRALRHKLFPGAFFLWLPLEAHVDALEIRQTIKAELPL